MKPRPLRLGIATGLTDAYRQGVRDATRWARRRPCVGCYTAGRDYVRAALAHYMKASRPTRRQQQGATMKVARALHEIHAARSRDEARR